MQLDFGKHFTVLRVFGVFVSLLLAFKVYGYISDYHPGAMNQFGPGKIFGLTVGLLVICYCFTMYWRIELKANSIVSHYGFALLRRTKVFTGIKSIQFKIDFTEVKNGPDQAYIHVLLEVDGRDRPYSMFSLHQRRESIIAQSHYDRKHLGEINQFNDDVARLLALYPKVPRQVDDKVVDFYESVTARNFTFA